MLPGIRRLRWLSPARVVELSTATAVLVVVRAALARLPFETVREALARAVPLGAPSAHPVADAERVLQAVRLLERRVPGTSCLAAALTAQVLLRRRGALAELKIGIANEGGFRAHAWLELDGAIVLGESLEHFEELPLAAAPRGGTP